MSKHNNRSIASSLSRATELPLDLLGSKPIFHLFSDNELVVEGAKNLEYYDDSCVKICLSKKSVTVCGDGLNLKCLSNGNLSVLGNIISVSLERHNI